MFSLEDVMGWTEMVFEPVLALRSYFAHMWSIDWLYTHPLYIPGYVYRRTTVIGYIIWRIG